MTKRELRPVPFLLVVLTLAFCALLAPRVARACGGFFSRSVLEAARRPSLSYERTLIVFDQEKQREHFVREVAFRAAQEPFGFVVPVPSRPEIAAMKSPFDALEREYPFSVGLGSSRGRGGGTGSGAPRAAAVSVLEVKQVGSFTSFVLAADDAKALSAWLTKNGFSTTPESERWLSHYVKLKFFYVAMRYSPPAARKQPERTRAETVRISFDTPLAYYPYLEPEPEPGRASAPRMLDLWLVSQSRTMPVAARRSGNEMTWVRPLAAGRRVSTTARDRLKSAFGAAYELLPEGPVHIQRFIDQKQSRSGYGDILFVPDRPTAPNPEAMARLYPILDPSLLTEAAAP